MTETLRSGPAADLLHDQCADLGISATVTHASDTLVRLRGPSGEHIDVDLTVDSLSMIEQVLRGIRFRFDDLALLTVGDSKEIRLLTPKVSLARLLPTVYSFTNNRYGRVPGTETVRARFSAEVFRAMERSPGDCHLATAFLGLVESDNGPPARRTRGGARQC